MRKGVSLSLETIVVLVLAVLVLAVLLYFFSSNFYPAQTKIDDLNKQRELCAEYVNNYPRCDSTAFPKMSDLSKVCLKLGYQSCNNPNSIFCVQECCAILCGTTATCEQRQGTCTPDTGCTSPRQNYGQLNCGINQVCCV